MVLLSLSCMEKFLRRCPFLRLDCFWFARVNSLAFLRRLVVSISAAARTRRGTTFAKSPTDFRACSRGGAGSGAYVAFGLAADLQFVLECRATRGLNPTPIPHSTPPEQRRRRRASDGLSAIAGNRLSAGHCHAMPERPFRRAGALEVSRFARRADVFGGHKARCSTVVASSHGPSRARRAVRLFSIVPSCHPRAGGDLWAGALAWGGPRFRGDDRVGRGQGV